MPYISILFDEQASFFGYWFWYGLLTCITWLIDLESFTYFCLLLWCVEVWCENICECSKVRNMPVLYSRCEAGTSVYFGHISSFVLYNELYISKHFYIDSKEPAITRVGYSCYSFTKTDEGHPLISIRSIRIESLFSQENCYVPWLCWTCSKVINYWMLLLWEWCTFIIN